MRFGDYPLDYDRKLHGPYDPSRYYGKPDTPFGEVKLADLGSWFGRRTKNPQAFAALCSRAWWRWQHKYIHPKRTGIAPFFQISVVAMGVFYYLNYGKIKHHKKYKYH